MLSKVFSSLEIDSMCVAKNVVMRSSYDKTCYNVAVCLRYFYSICYQSSINESCEHIYALPLAVLYVYLSKCGTAVTKNI